MPRSRVSLGLMLLLLLSSLVLVESYKLGWRENTDYTFSYSSTTSIQGNGKEVMESCTRAEIILRPYYVDEETASVLLEIVSAEQSDGSGNKDQVSNLLKSEGIYEWFSFRQARNGRITEVFYKDEETRIVALKKAIVGSFSANLLSKIDTNEDTHNYSVQDNDHTGQHDSEYSVKREGANLIYSKTKYNTEFESKQRKELRVHATTGLIQEIRVYESFKVPKTGLNKKNMDRMGKFGGVPDMSGSGDTEIKFLSMRERTGMVQVPGDLKNDTLEAKIVGESTKEVELAEVIDDVKEHVFCLLNSDIQAQGSYSDCFRSLIHFLSKVNAKGLKKFSKPYFSCNSNISTENAGKLVDILAQIGHKKGPAQDLIVEYFLQGKSCLPIKLSQRALYQVFSYKQPNHNLVSAVEDLCFGKLSIRDSHLSNTACLALGAIARGLSESETEETERIVDKINSLVLPHYSDAYEQQRKIKRSTRNHATTNLKQAVLVSALGNAGHRSSYKLIASLASNSIPSLPKRSAFHALRHFHTDEAANTLLKAVLFHSNSIVRNDAMREYNNHPAGVSLDTLREELSNFTNQDSSPANTPLSRAKRSVVFADLRSRYAQLDIRLYAPSVDWKRKVGSEDIGAEFGMSGTHGMQLEIRMLEGTFKLELDEEAYAKLNFGFVGENLEMFRTQVCHKGEAQYDLNILQEFSPLETRKKIILFDRVACFLKSQLSDVLDNISVFESRIAPTGYLREYAINLPFLVHQLVLNRTQEAVFYKYVHLFDVWKLLSLYDGFKSTSFRLARTIETFHAGLGDCLAIDIFVSAKQIQNSISAAKKRFKDFITHPLSVIEDLAQQVSRIGDGICVLAKCSTSLQSNISTREGIPTGIYILSNKITLYKSELEAGSRAVVELFDWIKSLTYVTNDATKEAESELLGVIQNLINTADSVTKVIRGILQSYRALTQTQQLIEGLHETLARRVELARGIITEIFGYKFHHLFPNTITSSNCESPLNCTTGIFPSTLPGVPAPGIRLKKLTEHETMIAPVTGYFSKGEISNSVKLQPISPLNAFTFYLYNVNPSQEIMRSTGIGYKVYAGQSIGYYTDEYIFLVKVNASNGSLALDPTKHLTRRITNDPTYETECNDYRISRLDGVMEMGTLGNFTHIDSKTENLPEGDQDLDLDKNSVASLGLKGIESLQRYEPEFSLDYGPLNGIEGCSWCVKEHEKQNDLFSPENVTSSYPQQSCLADNKELLIQNFNYRVLQEYTVSELITFLNETGGEKSAQDLVEIVSEAEEEFLKLNREIYHPRTIPTRFLQWQLQQFDISSSYARSELIDAYLSAENAGECSNIHSQLPEDLFCRVTSNCLVITCAISINTGLHTTSHTVGIAIDPCGSVTYKFDEWRRIVEFDNITNSGFPALAQIKVHGFPATLVIHLTEGHLFANLEISNSEPCHLFCGGIYSIFEGVIFPHFSCEANTPELDPTIGISIPNLMEMSIKDLVILLDQLSAPSLKLTVLLYNLRNTYQKIAEENTDPTLGLLNTEFEEERRYITSGFHSIAPLQMKFFSYTANLMLGSVPVTFDFDVYGFIGSEIQFSMDLTNFIGNVGNTPNMGLFVSGDLRMLLGEYSVGAKLKGDLLNVELPITGSIHYQDVPLQISLRADLMLQPLQLSLIGYLEESLTPKKSRIWEGELWYFSELPENTRLFDLKQTHSDATPPVYNPVEIDTIDGENQMRGGCVALQAVNRDYTNPAFLLQVDAIDDMSDVSVYYSIGSYKGGEDIVEREVMDSNFVLIPLYALKSTALHFTVHAINSQGLESISQCVIPSYDVTPPIGRASVTNIFSSNPNYLEVDVSILKGSEITAQYVSIGYGQGYSEQIIPFQPFEFKNIDNNIVYNDSLARFAPQFQMKLIAIPVKSSLISSAKECALFCIEISVCLSFNYNPISDQCELLKQIAAEGIPFLKDREFNHYERLGESYTANIIFSSLDLIHNRLYFFNILVENKLGQKSLLTSEGVLTDFTPPEPGVIVGGSEEVRFDGCNASYNLIEENRCYQPYEKLEHRIIRDGPGSKTVFNGNIHGVDRSFYISGFSISANFDGFRDNESGIYGFRMFYGRAPCENMLQTSINPHQQYHSMEDWTYIGTISHLSLAEGKYYISIEAINNAILGGPGVTTVCHTTPYVIDRTRPIVNSVSRFPVNETSGELSIHINASDSLSLVHQIEYSIGTTPRETDFVPWSNLELGEDKDKVDLVGSYTVFHNFPDGTFFVRIRVENNVGLQTVYTLINNPIRIDLTKPLDGIVHDGEISGVELEFTSSNSSLCAHWEGFSDPDSGIKSYELSFRNSTHTLAVKDVGTLQSSCSDNLFLTHDTRYYAVVKATNGAETPRSTVVTSNGVLVDLTPPIPGSIHDGSSLERDLHFTSDSSTISAVWSGYTDPQSEINLYRVSVGKSNIPPYYSDKTVAINTNLTVPSPVMGDGQKIVDSIVVGLDTSYSNHRFRFMQNDFLLVTLEAVNGALLTTISNSTGILIDLSPPELLFIKDGALNELDTEYQTFNDSITVSFSMVDLESGIERYEISLFRYFKGERGQVATQRSFKTVPSYPGENGVSHQETVSSLDLMNGYRYHTRVKVFNQAGLYSSYSTDGVTVDSTPPMVDYVRIGTPNQQADIINGIVRTSDSNSLSVYWQATDPQSGILYYNLSLGTYPTCDDILTQRFTVQYARLTGINLSISNDGANTIQYCVSIIAVNRAGESSNRSVSNPVIVLPGDIPGVVTIGHSGLENDAFQSDTNTLTIHFNGFKSDECGIRFYEWGVGTTSYITDVMPFTSSGLVMRNETHGQAQGFVPLRHGQTYYATVRATTGCLNRAAPSRVIESASSGIRIDVTAPELSAEIVIDVMQESEQLYQTTTDDLQAVWYSRDNESGITSFDVDIGSFPGGANIFQAKDLNYSYIPAGSVQPWHNTSNFVTITAHNAAGLASSYTTRGVSVDTTEPNIGTFICPESIPAGSDTLHCEWNNFSDPQSAIAYFELSLGKEERDNSTFQSILDGAITSYTISHLNGSAGLSQGNVFVTLTTVNVIGLKSYISRVVIVDATPPEVSKINLVTTTADTSIDPGCSPALTSIRVYWSPFVDQQSGIDRYLLGVGLNPGEFQIHSLRLITYRGDPYTIHGLRLESFLRVYVTLRVYNKAGLYSTQVSDPIQTTTLHAQRVEKSFVNDGLLLSVDSRFQDSLTTAAAQWYFSSRCPTVRYEWGIFLANGTILQSFNGSSVPPNVTNGINDGLTLDENQTYYVVVKKYNQAGYVETMRSNGVSIRIEPPRAGQVFDGLVPNHDFNYQINRSHISAIWTPFGLDDPDQLNQKVAHYEVAVGTGRSTESDQSNIVSFTNVGGDRNVTFPVLPPLSTNTIYYFTVRAISVSGTQTEVTTNGISVLESACSYVDGSVTLPRFQSFNRSIAASWSGFQSCVPWDSYQYALSTFIPTHDPCADIATNNAEFFDISPFQEAKLDTSVTLLDLSLQHNKSYYLTLRAIDEAAQCLHVISEPLLVDTTPPVVDLGYFKVGFDQQPFIAQQEPRAHFITSTDLVYARWFDFFDQESGLEYYEVGLYQSLSCSDLVTMPSSSLSLITSVRLGLETEHTFYELNLSPDNAYYLKLTVYNKAGASTEDWSNPILLDLELASSGDVRHGVDWYQPLAGYQSAASSLQGSIAYLYTSLIDAFRLQDNHDPLSEPIWNNFTANRLDAFPSFLYDSQLTEQPYPSRRTVYQSSQVVHVNTEIMIKTQPDIEYERMRTGAVLQSARELFLTNSWAIDIRASDSKDIITSVQLFERTPRFIQEFEVNFDEMVASYNSTVNGTVQSLEYTCTPRQGLLSEVHAPNCINSSKQLDCAFASSYPPISERRHPAVGFQLYKGDSEVLGRILFWSRPSESRISSIWATLPFDPSSEYHTYQLQLDTKTDQTVIKLIANGLEVARLNELPELTAEKAQFLLHAWNKNRTVLPFTNPFAPPVTYSYFHNRTLNTAEIESRSSIQSKGKPFIHINSPILEFEIGVGTSPDSTDVLNFTSIFKPCIPCNTPCAIHYCNSTCFNKSNDITTDYSVYSFTLTNLNLSTGEIKNGNITQQLYSNSPNLSDALIERYSFLPTVYYLTVRGITASGRVLRGVSSGVQVDFTPPQCTSIAHREPGISLNTPVGMHQINSTSLAVFYTCEDLRSPIYQNWIGVGTGADNTDVRNFTLLPLSRTLLLSNLTLVPNTTYYVKVRVMNRAGLATILTSTGVQLFALPTLTIPIKLQAVSVESQPLNKLDDFLFLSRDVNTTGVAWQRVNQTNIQQVFWSAGTTPYTNDIIPRIEVGDRMDSFAILQDNKLIIGDIIRNYSDFSKVADDCLVRTAGLVLEPGRMVFHKVDLCSRDPLCIKGNLLSTLHIRKEDVLMPLRGMADPIQFTLELHGSFPAQVIASISGFSEQEDSYSYLVVGAIQRNEWSGISYGNGFSDYRPYIVDPQTTKLNTTRYLRDRILSFTNYTFFTSISNSRENISFHSIQFKISLNLKQFDFDNSEVSLLFWNRELSVWQDLRELCNESIFQINGNELITNYCYEYENPSQNVNLMLGLALLKPKIQTNPPMLLTSCFLVNEGSEQVMVQLKYCDNEFDPIEYSIASKTPSRKDIQPNSGNYSITRTGLLSYKPCPICTGDDVISVMLKETGEIANLGFALSPIATLEVRIVYQNDPPKLIARIDNKLNSDANIIVDTEGRVLDPTRTIFFYQNTSLNETQLQTPRDFQFEMISYDFDASERLTINSTEPTDGIITNTSIPLTIFIESNINSYIDTLYTYSPNISGNQTFKAIVYDQDFKFSQQITLLIRVFNNPCYNNGTCAALGDYNCDDVIRIENFSSFKCSCQIGYTGEYCEILTNLCLDADVTCGFNESCIPHFLDYSCYCGENWPCQGQLAVILGVSISISLVVTILVILVVIILVVLYFKYFHKQSKLFPKSKGVRKLKESVSTPVEMHELDDLTSKTEQVTEHQDGSKAPYTLFVDDTTDFTDSPFVAKQSREVFDV